MSTILPGGVVVLGDICGGPWFVMTSENKELYTSKCASGLLSSAIEAALSDEAVDRVLCRNTERGRRIAAFAGFPDL